jgi:hypothetical protein
MDLLHAHRCDASDSNRVGAGTEIGEAEIATRPCDAGPLAPSRSSNFVRGATSLVSPDSEDLDNLVAERDAIDILDTPLQASHSDSHKLDDLVRPMTLLAGCSTSAGAGASMRKCSANKTEKRQSGD